MPKSNAAGRWFPTQQQLQDPSSVERSFRQLLTQHYALQDQFDALTAKMNAQSAPASSQAPPPGCGPTDTQLLGLRVAPVDTETLADGTKLTYVKAAGNFQFK